MTKGISGCSNRQRCVYEFLYMDLIQRSCIEKNFAGNIMVGENANKFIGIKDYQMIYIFTAHLVKSIAYKAIGTYRIILWIFHSQYISNFFHRYKFRC